MSIFAKIRQVYDRLCERKEASADRMRQERNTFSEQADEFYKRERQIAVERDSKMAGLQRVTCETDGDQSAASDRGLKVALAFWNGDPSRSIRAYRNFIRSALRRLGSGGGEAVSLNRFGARSRDQIVRVG